MGTTHLSFGLYIASSLWGSVVAPRILLTWRALGALIQRALQPNTQGTNNRPSPGQRFTTPEQAVVADASGSPSTTHQGRHHAGITDSPHQCSGKEGSAQTRGSSGVGWASILGGVEGVGRSKGAGQSRGRGPRGGDWGYPGPRSWGWAASFCNG